MYVEQMKTGRLIGRAPDDKPTMDNPTLIRTAAVSTDGELKVTASATLVRDSTGPYEVAETRAKAGDILSAFGLGSVALSNGAPTSLSSRGTKTPYSRLAWADSRPRPVPWVLGHGVPFSPGPALMARGADASRRNCSLGPPSSAINCWTNEACPPGFSRVLRQLVPS